jgi:outer membrane lipoprotein-sorting protein
MRRLVTFPARRLWAIAGAVCLLALGAGIAQAALSGGAKPPAKPLDEAVHDALSAPKLQGLSADITFTNHLLPSGSIGGQGSSPLLKGATGRLWLAADGHARLELQSESGDAQVLSDGKVVSVYDPSSHTVYRATLPAEKAGATEPAHTPPTVADIQAKIAELTKAWNLSGAEPTTTAGQPSYTVRISPKDDGGLLGAAEVAWDAARGVPLKVAVYAQNQADPVLALEATNVTYGAIPAADFQAAPPAGAKVVQVDPGNHGSGATPDKAGKAPEVTGVDAVAKQLDFPLVAPAALAGLPRQDVRLVDFDGASGALTTYGKGLGAIVVLQRKAPAADTSKPADRGGVQLPQVNIDGATGQELATALGTVVTFERNGVSYTVAGSVPPVAAENAARGLR